MGCNRFSRVWLGFTGFYLVLLGLTGIYSSRVGFISAASTRIGARLLVPSWTGLFVFYWPITGRCGWFYDDASAVRSAVSAEQNERPGEEAKVNNSWWRWLVDDEVTVVRPGLSHSSAPRLVPPFIRRLRHLRVSARFWGPKNRFRGHSISYRSSTANHNWRRTIWSQKFDSHYRRPHPVCVFLSVDLPSFFFVFFCFAQFYRV